MCISLSRAGAKGPCRKWCRMLPARRRRLNTQNPIHTPTKVSPKKCRVTRRPAEAIAVLMASCLKAWCPCMMPSPTNTTPLIACSAAPMYEGRIAAARTSSSLVNAPSSGKQPTCSRPSVIPVIAPQTRSRSATCLAASSPPPSSAFLLRLWGTSTAVMELRLSSTMPPICQSWMVMACAAADVPVESIVIVARATARKVTFMARERS
mmetsp:Transcript_44502/g.141694  ORF Transcript_44502/g.141694 Transcript_44502/m.141694 type:complete len:208 (-) Transcript_44502:1232-1855(-)